jgi:hypothetical protein
MWKQICKTTAIAGALDITAACIQAYLAKKITPDIVLKYIASGLFGKQAFAGGFQYIIFGLLIHLFISLACTLVYFIIYPKATLLQKNILLSSLFIAVIAWVITTRIIIPLSNIQTPPFNIIKALIAIAVLYCCIGLPVSIFAKKYYNKT